jgi:hypothetical protein
MFDLSATTIRYLPGFRRLTFSAPFLTVMLNAGPTTAESLIGAADAEAANARAAITAVASTRWMRDIVLLDAKVSTLEGTPSWRRV